MKLRDHQHLSYDLFARQKGCNDSYGYKLRDLEKRYEALDQLAQGGGVHGGS